MKQSYLMLLFIISVITPTLSAQKYELIETKDEHSSPIESMEITPDGKTMICGHHDGYLVLWDLNTMKIIKKIRAHSQQINSILFNKSGSYFVTSGEDGRVALFEYPSYKMLKSIQTVPDVNTFAVLSPDNSTIFFGGANTNRNYNTTNPEPYGALYKVKVKGNDVPDVAFDDETLNGGNKITDGNLDYDGKHIVISKKYNLFFYGISSKKLDFKVTCPYMLNNFSFTKDAIYVWGDKMLMKLVKQNDSYVVSNTVSAGTRDVSWGYSKMVFSKNGKILATGDDGNNVNLWDADLNKIQTLSGHTDMARNFLFCKHDSTLITGGYDGKLLIWSLPKPVKDSIPPVIDVVFTENNIPVSIKDRDVELQSTITVSQLEFDIEIWDRSVVDGDSISLNLNGDWILQEYMVVKEKLKLHIKVNPKVSNNYLILYALNLGTISPNTAAVQVVIDGKEYKLTLTSDLKKSGALNFSYLPK